MDVSVRLRVLRHLAAIATAVSCGLADPAPRLLEVPAEVITELVDDAEGVQWRNPERVTLLRLLTHDSRVAIRSRVAEAIGVLWPTSAVEARQLVHTLARDPSRRVRHAAGEGLARIVVRASLVDRVQIVSEWASSSEAHDRAAIARALQHATPVAIADIAIESLAEDREPEVRRAALEAVARRFDESPALYRRTALRRLNDADLDVRRAARHLVARHA